MFGKVEGLIAARGELAGDDLRMFTQTLFNRLMFLRFMDKGWLSFGPRKDYLRALGRLITKRVVATRANCGE